MDAWTDIKGRNFAAITLNYPLPIFHSSVDLSSVSEDEESVLGLLGGVRRSLGLEQEPDKSHLDLPAKQRISRTKLFGGAPGFR